MYIVFKIQFNIICSDNISNTYYKSMFKDTEIDIIFFKSFRFQKRPGGLPRILIRKK